MNKTEITITKLDGLVSGAATGEAVNLPLVMTMHTNVLPLGFVFTEKLIQALARLPEDRLVKLYSELVPVLRRRVGAHVRHKPMYPNFPKQVMQMSDIELHLNALLHYFTYGAWLPEYQEEIRPVAFEKTTFRQLDLCSEEDFTDIFTRILSSRESVSDYDRKVVEWFLENTDVSVPESIPYKENLCLVAAHKLKQGHDISEIVTNATDVLRLCTWLSGGDVSLSTNTRFRSFTRPERRMIVSALEKVMNVEDIKRHRKKWVRLAHSLHVGDYSSKVYDILKAPRENQRIVTFSSKVEELVTSNRVMEAADLLVTRPSEFARRLDDMLCRLDGEADRSALVERFRGVCAEVPTRILIQLYGHLNARDNGSKRFVFPKGNTQKAILLPAKAVKLDATAILWPLRTMIVKTLTERFSKLAPLGTVYLDRALLNCPIPTAQRSASESLMTVARGTRLPLDFPTGNNNTLRFFLYWVGQDIDLSASFHDENFDSLGHISYTCVRDSEIQAYYSGDITYAPNGASEFIDVDIESALAAGVRYVVMNVFVYSGPNFVDHETCFAGWMTRAHQNSNEIYEPLTVEQKVDLTTASRNAIPAVFDLARREVIWCDLATKSNHWGNQIWTRGNNIEGNRATVRDMLELFATMDNKVSLYQLFSMHLSARGVETKSREDADVVFDLSTAYEINRINSEFLV